MMANQEFIARLRSQLHGVPTQPCKTATTESEVYNSHSEELYHAIAASNPQALAQKLSQHGLIPKDAVSYSGLTSQMWAKIIVEAVAEKIDHDPVNFRRFVQVLNSDSDTFQQMLYGNSDPRGLLKALGKKLNDAYSDQSTTSHSKPADVPTPIATPITPQLQGQVVPDTLPKGHSTESSSDTSTASNTASPILGPENQKLLEDALTKQGYVLMQIIKLLVMGIAGAGKTSVKNQLVAGLPPLPSGRNSTMLLEAPIRAISRIITTKESDARTGTKWSVVSDDELLHMIAVALKENEVIMESDEAATAQSQSLGGTTSGNSISRSSTDELPQSQNSSSQPSPAKLRLMELLASGQASAKLSLQWVHIIDTGGQPQFRTLLPSVVHNMSMIMHVLRLCDSLDEYPVIELYKNGKRCCNPSKSAQTHEQILQQAVQSIQVQSLLMPGETDEIKGERPKMIIVGTHRDLESNSDEKRAQKNTRILELLKPIHNDVVLCSSPNEVIFGIDAINPNEEDKKVVGKIHTEVDKLFDSKVCSKHKVPLGWFLLQHDICAAAKGKGVVSLEECLDIARSLTISDEALKAALSYFHELNVFLYYPALLPNVVFCDPQVPLNIISALVTVCYSIVSGQPLEGTLDGTWLQLREKGIVTMKMLEDDRFREYFVPDIFTPVELFSLLQYLFIAAPLSSTKCSNSDVLSTSVTSSNGPGFSDKASSIFVPCFLPTCPSTEIRKWKPVPSRYLHLLLRFTSGCVPIGIFSNVVVRLCTNTNWTISRTGGVFSNLIKFSMSDYPFSVTIIDSFDYIEVRVEFQCPCDFDSSFEHVFPQILNRITGCINDASKSLNFKECTPVPAFLCRVTGHKNNPHASEIVGNQFCRCSVDPEVCFKLNKDELLWLRRQASGLKRGPSGQASSLMPASKKRKPMETTVSDASLKDYPLESSPGASTATAGPALTSAGPKPLSNPPRFEDLMDEVAAALPKKWEEIAIKFGLPETEIERIETIQNPSPNRYYRQVFNYWKKNTPKPYCWTTVVEALKSPTVDESGLASDLESRIRCL